MATTYGVYIHIPFCKSKCDYCDFYSLAGREEEMDHYQKALIAHLRSFAPRLKGRVADTIYFGGGTPSYYGEKRLRELLVLIQRRRNTYRYEIHILDEAEIIRRSEHSTLHYMFEIIVDYVSDVV